MASNSYNCCLEIRLSFYKTSSKWILLGAFLKQQDDKYDLEPSLLWGLRLFAIEVGIQLQWLGLITKKGIGATGSYLWIRQSDNLKSMLIQLLNSIDI